MGDPIHESMAPDRPQGGTKDDDTFPDGLGEVSPEQDVHPSRQPVPTPRDVTRRK
jgi:hypothetical protein